MLGRNALASLPHPQPPMPASPCTILPPPCQQLICPVNRTLPPSVLQCNDPHSARPHTPPWRGDSHVAAMAGDSHAPRGQGHAPPGPGRSWCIRADAGHLLAAPPGRQGHRDAGLRGGAGVLLHVRHAAGIRGQRLQLLVRVRHAQVVVRVGLCGTGNTSGKVGLARTVMVPVRGWST